MTPPWHDLGIDVPAGARGNVKTHCPQCTPTRQHPHDKSLSVDVERGLFCCHNCGWSGSLVSGGGQRGSPPSGAPLRPQERTRTFADPPPLPAAELSREVMAWLAHRGIPPDVAREAGVRSAPGEILFPYTRAGRVINVKHRSLTEKKFWLEAGCELAFYGLDWCRGAEQITLCEGEADALALRAVGVKAVLSVPSGAPNPGQRLDGKKFDFMASGEEVLTAARILVIATDGDEPGQVLARELIRRLNPERCFTVSWPLGCKDANDVLLKYGADRLRAVLAAAKPVPIEGILYPEELREEVWRLRQSPREDGADPGWPGLRALYRPAPGQLTIVGAIPGHGKALALDTPLPTPTGWTTMGEVQAGDWLLDEQGQPCRVRRVTPVMHGHPCYRLTWSDGAEIVADAEHQWLTVSDKARASARNARTDDRLNGRPVKRDGTDQTHKRTFPSVVTTAQIAVTLKARDKTNHAIPLTKPLMLPAANLPVAPYVLGVWLGDGTSANGSICTPDPEVIAAVAAAGWSVTPRQTPLMDGVAGLTRVLRQLGMLGDKRIPLVYLRASREQRMALLEGLMDTDGHITRYGRGEYTTVREELAEDVAELVRTLGWKPVLLRERARLKGRDVGPKFRVTFTPDRPVARLPRKRERCVAKNRPTNGLRDIVGCEPVVSVPVRCLEVDSPSHLYLAGRAMIPTHNTAFLNHLAVNLATTAGWRFAICSPEQFPPSQELADLVQILAGKPLRDGPTPPMTEAEFTAAYDWIADRFTLVLPKVLTIETIMARVRVLVLRDGVQGLIIDPWTEVDMQRPPGVTATDYIEGCLKQLRQFGRLHGLHTWIAVHPAKLSKVVDGTGEVRIPVPSPYDLADSRHWYGMADNIVAVWRDKADPDSPVELHVQKIRHRHYGQEGMTTLWFDRVTGRYRDTPAVVRKDH